MQHAVLRGTLQQQKPSAARKISKEHPNPPDRTEKRRTSKTQSQKEGKNKNQRENNKQNK